MGIYILLNNSLKPKHLGHIQIEMYFITPAGIVTFKKIVYITLKVPTYIN